MRAFARFRGCFWDVCSHRNLPENEGLEASGAASRLSPRHRSSSKQAAELFTDEERTELIDFLAANPQAGDEFPGAGGVRKLRFAAKGKGKRGGARVIYYWYSDEAPIYALLGGGG